jgi:putative flippase GtrA
MTVGIGALGRVGRSGRLLIKELGAFGVVGAFSFLLDIAVFQLLYAELGVGAVTSKFLATVLSMTVAYFGHRYWSFSHRARTGVRREYLLFVTINGTTLLVGMAVVAFVRYPLGQDDALILQVANIASIVLSTALRYIAYRRWVFPAHAEPATESSESASRMVA